MPDRTGLEVYTDLRKFDRRTPVVFVTSMTSADTAIEAMKLGALDYLFKPVDLQQLRRVVGQALELSRLLAESPIVTKELPDTGKGDAIIGFCPAMREVYKEIGRVAAQSVIVLVTGESGTGKEVVARAIHTSGERSGARFVAVNCGALPEPLLESELFGHVKGSFTGATMDHRGLFEEAEGGTLFLDEIAELPTSMQVKLNRALQERTVRRVGASSERAVDVRIIAATNVDLRARVAAGQFREDLFYRINVLHLTLPPLRERTEDIPALAAFLLDRHGARRDRRPQPSVSEGVAGGRGLQGFTPEALSALVQYRWPGNVRELENAVERAVAVTDGPRIELEALPDEVAAVLRPRLTRGTETMLTYREVVDLARDRASREYLIALMRELGGNVTEAARRAGMERESLHRLLKRYGVRSEDFKAKA